jgi:hypothetical protein
MFNVMLAISIYTLVEFTESHLTLLVEKCMVVLILAVMERL